MMEEDVRWVENAVLPPELINVVHIAGGDNHFVAITDIGSAWTWGQGQNGEADSSQKTPRAVQNLVGIRAVRASCGVNHSNILTADGKVWELGATPRQISLPLGWRAVAISSGDHYSVALNEDGVVMSWGNEADGRLGRSRNAGDLPAAVNFEVPVAHVACGGIHGVAVASGQVFIWGGGEASVRLVNELSGRDIVCLACSSHNCIVVDEGSGSALLTRFSGAGLTLCREVCVSDDKIIDVDCCSTVASFLTESGVVYTMQLHEGHVASELMQLNGVSRGSGRPLLVCGMGRTIVVKVDRPQSASARWDRSTLDFRSKGNPLISSSLTSDPHTRTLRPLDPALHRLSTRSGISLSQSEFPTFSKLQLGSGVIKQKPGVSSLLSGSKLETPGQQELASPSASTVTPSMLAGPVNEEKAVLPERRYWSGIGHQRVLGSDSSPKTSTHGFLWKNSKATLPRVTDSLVYGLGRPPTGRVAFGVQHHPQSDTVRDLHQAELREERQAQADAWAGVEDLERTLAVEKERRREAQAAVAELTLKLDDVSRDVSRQQRRQQQLSLQVAKELEKSRVAEEEARAAANHLTDVKKRRCDADDQVKKLNAAVTSDRAAISEAQKEVNLLGAELQRLQGRKRAAERSILELQDCAGDSERAAQRAEEKRETYERREMLVRQSLATTMAAAEEAELRARENDDAVRDAERQKEAAVQNCLQAQALKEELLIQTERLKKDTTAATVAVSTLEGETEASREKFEEERSRKQQAEARMTEAALALAQFRESREEAEAKLEELVEQERSEESKLKSLEGLAATVAVNIQQCKKQTEEIEQRRRGGERELTDLRDRSVAAEASVTSSQELIQRETAACATALAAAQEARDKLRSATEERQAAESQRDDARSVLNAELERRKAAECAYQEASKGIEAERKSCEHLQNQCKEYEEEAAVLQKRGQSISEVIVAARSHLQQEQQALLSLQESEKEAQSKLQANKEENEAMKHSHSVVMQELQSVEDECRQMQQATQEAEKCREKVSDELSDTKKRMAEFEADRNVNVARLEDATRQLEGLKQENSSLSQKVAQLGAQIQALEVIRSQAMQNQSALEEDLGKKTVTLQQQNEELSTLVSVMERLEQQAREAAGLVEQFESEHKTVQGKLDQSRQAAAGRQKGIDEARTEVQRIERAREEQVKTLEHLNGLIEEHSQARSLADAAVVKAEKEVIQEGEDRRLAEQSRAQVCLALESARSERLKAEQMQDSASKELDRARNEKREMEGAAAAAREEMQIAQLACADAEKEITALKSQIIADRESGAQAEEMLSTLRPEAATVLNTKRQTANQVELLKQEIATCRMTLQSLEMDKGMLQEELARDQERISTARSDLQNLRASLPPVRESCVALDRELSKATSILDGARNEQLSLERSLRERREEHQRLSESLQTGMAQLSELRAATDRTQREIEEHEKEARNLQNNRERDEAAAAEAYSRLVQLRSNADRAAEEVKVQRSALNRVQHETKAVEAELQSVVLQRRRTEEALSAQRNAVSAENKEIDEARRQVEAVQAEVKQAANALANALSQRETLQQQSARLTIDFDRVQADVKEMQSGVRAGQERVQEAMIQVSGLQRQREEAESQVWTQHAMTVEAQNMAASRVKAAQDETQRAIDQRQLLLGQVEVEEQARIAVDSDTLRIRDTMTNSRVATRPAPSSVRFAESEASMNRRMGGTAHSRLKDSNDSEMMRTDLFSPMEHTGTLNASLERKEEGLEASVLQAQVEVDGARQRVSQILSLLDAPQEKREVEEDGSLVNQTLYKSFENSDLLSDSDDGSRGVGQVFVPAQRNLDVANTEISNILRMLDGEK